jgi:23S rRNA (guanosine2251-2'-O)-methyltransferase
MDNKNSTNNRDESSIVEGRNAVFELLRSGRNIEKLYIAKDMNRDIVEKARAMHVQVSEIDKRKLEAMSEGGNAQGVIALCSPIEYSTVDDMIALAQERGEKPFIIICDGLNSPHNLGAIIRTAECAGAHGVVIPVHRSIGITPTVTRVSEGAVNHMLICKAVNIRNVLEDLKEKGVWTACADMDGDPYTKTDLNIPLALVVGGEDKGITPLIKKTCDMVLAIPQKGRLNSLNASVAAAVMMYEVVRQRG